MKLLVIHVYLFLWKKKNVGIAILVTVFQIFPPFGGSDGARCDRKYIYSRFRPIRTYRDTSDDHHHFTCCAFSVSMFLVLMCKLRNIAVYDFYFRWTLPHMYVLWLFQACETFLMLGNSGGELKLFNLQTAEVIAV